MVNDGLIKDSWKLIFRISNIQVNISLIDLFLHGLWLVLGFFDLNRLRFLGFVLLGFLLLVVLLMLMLVISLFVGLFNLLGLLMNILGNQVIRLDNWSLV